MISANLKADAEQQEIYELVAVSFIFYRSTFKTWNTRLSVMTKDICQQSLMICS